MNRIVFCLLFICFSRALFGETVPVDVLRHYSYVTGVVREPSRLQGVPFSMRIIAFSIASDGLKAFHEQDKQRKDEIEQTMKRLTRLALGPYASPFTVLSMDTPLDEYGLYLSHVNIILSNYYAVTGSREYLPLQTKINRYLIERCRAGGEVGIRSFPGWDLRFPADQAAVIYSLRLYDTTYGMSLGSSVIESWFSLLTGSWMNRSYGLPVSETTGGIWYASYPRGCAVPYLIYYISKVNPGLAQQFWTNFVLHFKGTISTYGLFREWVKNPHDQAYSAGLERWTQKYRMSGDNDSGPIIAG